MTYNANVIAPGLIDYSVQKASDITIRDFGTVWSFTPQTEAAEDFLRELVTESWQWSGTALIIDWRPAQDLLTHIELDTDLSCFLI